MNPRITDSTMKVLLAAIASKSATTQEKIEMLLEMAQGFQKKPKTAQDLRNAVTLYYRAYELCGEEYSLLKARAKVGMAGTFKLIPDTGAQFLLQAKTGYEEALPILQEFATPEEVAETQMNLGLVLQLLVPFNLARIADCIHAYHQALKHIKLTDRPREYAMLQNNLGNALQYLSNIHPLENKLQAIAAYDEALKVRNSRDTPLEYANTISNKANILFNLSDNPEKPEVGNRQNLLQARDYYQEAWEIFNQHGQIEQAQIVVKALQNIELKIVNGS
jgi:tetratricopeptide (TPR) repeat protein